MDKRLHKIILLPMFVFVFCPTAPCAGMQVNLTRNGDRIDVLIGGRPFTTFHFETDVAKPYLSPLRSAQGTVITRGFPMITNLPDEDHDEPHQRAMYFAHGDVNGYDFWGEAAFRRWSRHPISMFGRAIFRKIGDMRSGPEAGEVTVDFDLATIDGTVIASETQTYIFRGDERTRIIDCEFTIRADHGPVTMGDTKEGTFAIRVVKGLESPPGHIVNSNGATGEKAVWGRRADWVDFYGNVAGEEVGIAVFDNPENFRHPTYWHARHYGLLAANPLALKEFTHDRHQDGSYTIPAGETLTLRYRVLIHHGDYRAAGVANAYSDYAAER